MEQHANNYVQLIMGEKTLSLRSLVFFHFFFQKKKLLFKKVCSWYARGIEVIVCREV